MEGLSCIWLSPAGPCMVRDPENVLTRDPLAGAGSTPLSATCGCCFLSSAPSVKASGPLSSVEAPNSQSSLTPCMSLVVELTMGLAIISAVASPQILLCLCCGAQQLSTPSSGSTLALCLCRGTWSLSLTVCTEGVKKSLHSAPAIFDKTLPHCLLMPVSVIVAENQNNQGTCLLTFCITTLLNCSENRFSSFVLLVISDGL